MTTLNRKNLIALEAMWVYC